MRLSSRRSDDADVIRARLRALLAESRRPGGWLPDEADIEGGGAGDGGAGDGGAGDGGAEEDVADPGPTGGSWLEPESDESEAEYGLPSGIGRHRAPGTAVRLDPGRRGAWSLWAAGLTAALLLAGWTWLDRPQVQAAPASAPAAPPSSRSAAPSPPVGEAAVTSSTVVVSVVGRVRRPGLVTLATGARVADAITAAGGLLSDTESSSVNLAAVVSDGEQIAVGVPGPGGAPSGTAGGASGTAAGASSAGGAAARSGPAARLNLNTATVTDLDGLPGIGPVLAQRIIDYRDQQGRFTSVDQLDDVPGIGPAIAARLAELVTV